MLATVGRSDRHAHAFAQPVWRLVRPHIDHIDLEIRIQRVVVHHGERNILAMLPRAFEAGEAHIVFHVGFARNERPERALWGVHWQHQHLGGGFRPGANHDVPFVEGQSDAHPEAFIRLAVDLHVIRDGGADTVAHHRVRTPCAVEQHVEHPLRVRREAGAADALEPFLQLVAGLKIADAEIVAFVAARVGAVQHPAAVLGDVHAADTEEIMALRLGVGVEHHLFAVEWHTGLHRRRIPIVRAANRHPALHGILFALLGAGEVPVAIHARRHGHVGFLHMRFEFLEQRFAQRFERRHALFAVAVLRRHIVAHILRFLVAQPFVVIDERIAVEGALLWHPLRFRHRQSILVFVVRVRRFLHVHGVFHTPKFTHARDYTGDPPKLASAVSRRFARRAGTAAWFS